MVNKGVAEQHGGPNNIELNWQVPLNFPSSAFQNKRAAKTHTHTKPIGGDGILKIRGHKCAKKDHNQDVDKRSERRQVKPRGV